jgi:hypothetical protein
VYVINHDFGRLSRRTSLLQAFAWFPIAQLFFVFLFLPFLFYSGILNLFVNPPLSGSFLGAFGIGIGLFLFTTLFPFVGPLIIKALGRLDEDDYLGGFVLTVAAEGPDIEVIGFDLNGSDGIDLEGGGRYSGTSGTVDYTVNMNIVRFD